MSKRKTKNFLIARMSGGQVLVINKDTNLALWCYDSVKETIKSLAKGGGVDAKGFYKHVKSGTRVLI